AWARWSRPWANIAWVWLTGGLALGSWWAYYELGWGGWWAWDPVENPPLIAWLLGTALMHSLAVTEKRGVFKSWTVLLAILAFAGCLLGTFITRSGLLTSVHAFASDPTRGVFILAFIAITLGGSLVLYAIRAPLIKNESSFSAVSREVFLLINNILLVVASASVLLGTLFPMVYQAITDGMISIGPPYFNAIFVPLMAILAIALGIGPISRWKNTSVAHLRKQLTLVALASIALGIIVPLVVTLEFSLSVTIGVTLAFWLLLSIGKDIRDKVANKDKPWKALLGLPASYLGMQCAHFGVAVMIVGVSLTSYYSMEKSVLLSTGQSIDLGEYDFQFMGSQPITGPNYVGDEATILVSHNGEFFRELHPEKRVYVASGSPSTEMAIDSGFFRDLFVTLGEGRDNGATWSMTLYVKPFVRWIWLGAIFMGIGGVTAALDRRYRKLRVKDKQRLEAEENVTTPTQPQAV
ncbi:MAG: heme lyase CcmF/NrfE family subunit, partial [Gammaproteobacteria bacterium]|nr:heme lyase CcmF/NrfE family subunit [Gammaproteobacteria bacterium]